MGASNLVCVWVYGSRMEADLAKSLLDAAGIPALSEADTAGGMREHLAWSGAGFKIVVREEDAAEARELLTETAKGDVALDEEFGPDDDAHPSWRRFT